MNKEYDVIIVGAGASGLIAAGRVAGLGGKVLVIEKMKTAGRKLMITGKGRCNISSDASESEYYKNIFPTGRFLKHAFARFFSKDIVELLNNQGVETITERGDRIFPISNNAGDVVKALLKWVRSPNVDILYESRVEELIIDHDEVRGVKVMRQNKEINYYAKKIIIATGGKSYPATGSTGDGYRLAHQTGHKIDEVKPALVPLVVKGDLASKLQGLSLKNVNAIVWINGKKYKEAFGEMLFAHYGLTGPIILTLSRWVVQELDKNNKVEISIDLKPALDEKKLDARLLRDLDSHGKKQLENIFKLWLPAKLIPVFIQELKLDGGKPGHQMKADERRKILLTMKDLRFEITGNRGFKEAIITSGGVATSEIDGKTMESRLIKGLYFVGEVINLDGNTGGFNLQIAYSTAWLAAENCMSNKNL